MPNLLDYTGSLLRWWKKKSLRLQMFIKAHLHFNSKKKKMSTRAKRAQGKAAFLFAWGFNALKRFDLCPTFSQLIPHVFDSQSKPALARCSLSPFLLLLPTIRCPETTTYCLSGRFPPRLYPPHSPEALQRPCVYFTIVDEWKYICQTLHFPVCSPRVVPSAKFGRSCLQSRCLCW